MGRNNFAERWSRDRKRRESLKDVFDYDPSTGLVTRKLNGGGTARAGRVCDCRTKDGRRQIRFGGKTWRSTHIIWFLVYGRLPRADMVIDHINGDTSDDRLVNLREVTHADNMRKMRTPINNTSGKIGVYYHQRDNVWRARIKVNGVRLFKQFKTREAAIRQRETWEEAHVNHLRVPAAQP